MLEIRSAKVIVSCPGRNFVTLKIETEDGVYGPRRRYAQRSRARRRELFDRSCHSRA